MRVTLGGRIILALTLGGATAMTVSALTTPKPTIDSSSDYGHPSAELLLTLPECMKGPVAQQVADFLAGKLESPQNSVLSTPDDVVLAGGTVDEVTHQEAKLGSLSASDRQFQSCLAASQRLVQDQAAAHHP